MYLFIRVFDVFVIYSWQQYLILDVNKELQVLIANERRTVIGVISKLLSSGVSDPVIG